MATLTMPNNMTLAQSYEAQRDLLTGQHYKRGGTGVAERLYTYNALGIPTTRRTARQGTVRSDAFGYNERNELTSAELGSAPYAYAYDNIGNRKTAQEDAEAITYEANELNQYTDITTGEESFIPVYDIDGNQTRIRTSTGIWTASYNAQNRPTRFTRENADGTRTVITAAYDYMGRRAWKKVETIAPNPETGEETATITLHQRYIYRGYLQVAACDLTRGSHPCLWLITWDPTQPMATRPLVIQKDGTWYCYGWDLTKNICEVFGQAGYIRTIYSYTPYGSVTGEGDVAQPLQWSSEYADLELGLVYYNYRCYNPTDGRWNRRDPSDEDEGLNLYQALFNSPLPYLDILGLAQIITDMTNGYTYWIPTDCCCEKPQKFKSLNKVVRSAKPGANDPYKSEDTRVGHTNATKKAPIAYGSNAPILTGDLRGRWLHGGGTRLGAKGSQKPYQELCPTFGCTRLHNEDVKTLGNLRNEHRRKHPKEKVPYQRDHFEKNTVPPAYAQCLKEYDSDRCKQKRNKK